MPEEKQVSVEESAVCNIKNFTTIPNSNSEFCIYTYKAEYESYTQLTKPGFFNPAYSFLNVGDTVRVFRFETGTPRKLTHYLEFVVVEVDKVTKEVFVATIANHKLESKTLK